MYNSYRYLPNCFPDFFFIIIKVNISDEINSLFFLKVVFICYFDCFTIKIHVINSQVVANLA